MTGSIPTAPEPAPWVDGPATDTPDPLDGATAAAAWDPIADPVPDPWAPLPANPAARPAPDDADPRPAPADAAGGAAQPHDTRLTAPVPSRP
jgi:hypothetical protein